MPKSATDRLSPVHLRVHRRSQSLRRAHKARQPGDALTIEIRKDRLPYFVQSRKVTIQAAFRATGADTLTPLDNPVFEPTKNLWKLAITPDAGAKDALVMLVYTIA